MTEGQEASQTIDRMVYFLYDISMGVKCVLNIFVAVAVCNMCFTLETFYGKKKLRPLFVLWLQFFTRFEQVNLVSNK